MTASDWLLTDKVASWPGTSAERGWRYLRQSLERYDSGKSEYKYTKAVLDTLLLHDMHKSIPTWILQRIQVRLAVVLRCIVLNAFRRTTPNI